MSDTVVECYTGLMGGGKSYMAIEKIVQHLPKGGLVYTNLDLNWEVIKAWCKVEHKVILDDKQYTQLKTEELAEFQNFISAGTDENPVLVVIDECALFFNSRKWQESSSDMLAFLTQVRKVSVHLIFITQHIKDIDSQMRHRIHYMWMFTDLQKLKIMGITPPFPYMIRNCYAGVEKKARLFRRWVKKNTLIFSFYNSKQKFTDMKMKESPEITLEKVEEDTPKPVKRRLPTIIFVCIISLFMFNKFTKGDKDVLQGQNQEYSFVGTAESPGRNQETQDPEEEAPLYVRRFTQNGKEWFVLFTDGSFLTHHSAARVTYDYEYLIINSIPYLFLPAEMYEDFDDLQSQRLTGKGNS